MFQTLVNGIRALAGRRGIAFFLAAAIPAFAQTIPLTNGTPVTGLSGATGSEWHYSIDVPARATNIKIATSNGTGDVDLYVRIGAAPTTSSFDCRSNVPGNIETCTPTTTDVTYYILVKAYAAFSGVSLSATFTAPSSSTVGFTPTTDFTDNGDGTVTHKLTGLTWMRCALGQRWESNTCTGTANGYTFDQATALITTFAGHSDWRLPSPWELVSIVDYDVAEPGPTINNTIFPNTPSSGFWSGSPNAGVSYSAWGVGFGYGSAYGGRSSSYSLVRLVRGGQSSAPLTPPSSDFTDNGDGTVTHKKTNLG